MNSAQEDGRDAIKPSEEVGETMESAKLLDWDDSDEIPEDRDSDSDYGRPHKSKGKRMCGRLTTKPTEEARIMAAVEVRRKRMRLNHGTRDSNGKNPKRHLFNPLNESPDLSETASPTPSKSARTKNDMNKAKAATSSHPPAAGRVTRRKLATAENIPSKPLVNTPPSLRDNASPTTRPSLVVKLKHPRPSMTMGVDMRGTRKATKKRPKDRLGAPTSTSEHDNASDPPKPRREPLPLSTNTNAPILKPSSPLQVVSTLTLAPYPPMSPRSVSPFTRGARIALENLLADHQSDPLVSLINLVEELDDTRPIVNDWEHVTVMKGGSWIYQVMRDVWEEAAADVDDEEDDEMSDEDMDIEDIVEKVGKWVDKEMGRSNVVGQV